METTNAQHIFDMQDYIEFVLINVLHYSLKQIHNWWQKIFTPEIFRENKARQWFSKIKHCKIL